MRALAGVLLLLAVGLGVFVVWAVVPQTAAPETVTGREVQPQVGRPPQGDRFVYALGGGPPHLNVLTSASAIAIKLVLARTHDTLLWLDDRDGSLRPGVMASWQVSADGLGCTMTLREGVAFAGGVPVTQDDILFPWRLYQAGHRLPASFWSDLDGVAKFEADGERGFRLELKTPHFAGVARSATGYPVVQRAAVEALVAAQAEALGEPVPALEDPRFAALLLRCETSGPGTGPYRVSAWERGRRIALVRNEHSWWPRAEPACWNLDAIELLEIRDQTAASTALRRGELDFAMEGDAPAALAADPELARSFRAVQYGYATLGPAILGWNHDHEALGRAEVRRALTMLFDRPAIVALLAPRAVPARSWFRPEHRRDEGLEPVPHDVDAARALLAAAGFGVSHRLRLDVLVPAGMPPLAAAVEYAAPAAARAFVELVVEQADPAVIQQRVRARDFRGMLYLYNPGFWGDPFELLHSSQAPAPGAPAAAGSGLGSSNWMGYRSPRADALIERARVTFGAEARRAVYRELCDVLRDEQPFTVLFHQQVSALLHRRFQESSPGLFGLEPRRWWVAPADRLR